MSINKRRAARIILIAFAFLLKFHGVHAQNTVVLPANNNISKEIAPQGGARYQRQFYLITAAEMQAAGWSSGMLVNSIGFRLAVAQNDTTRGAFKVYLQNTTDTQSRLDTAWTSVSVTGSTYKATGLHAGRYEWQVVPVCTNTAYDTASSAFSNKDIGTCPQPTSLSTQNITANSAQFQWTAPASAASKYFVMYSRSDSINWILDSTTSTIYTASSLVAGTPYQWKVWSKCSNDTSTAVNTSFFTESAVNCSTAPSGLTNGTGTATTQKLSWTAVSSATRYDIQYRRQGTTQWNSSISFADTIKITQTLVAGTTYEWRIRTVCAAGTGAYVYGTPFTTTGTTVCYAPTVLSVDSLSSTAAKFKWNGTTSGTYTLRYRIKETISWTNATTPMTLVSNDTLIIPKTTGVYIHPFSGVSGSAFNYSGGGLYIAFEHSRDTGQLRSFNTAFARVEKDIIKSAATQVDTAARAQGTILDATAFRPETLLGSSTLKDSVEVSAVYGLGNYALGYSGGSSISARIVNHSQTARTMQVTLNVKDTTNNPPRYTSAQNVSVSAGSSSLVTFNGWNPTVLSTDSLIVSVPAQTGETLVSNNRNYYVQKVNSSIVGYDDLTQNISGGGLGAEAGLILTKYHMNGCGSVMGTRIFLAPGAKGKALSAVFVDTAGKILSRSESFTPDSVAINNYHNFYFSAPQSLTNVDYYVGLSQAASGTYFPVGIQWETENIRTSAYYKAPLAGGLLTDTSFGGRLMIDAEVIAGRAVAEINGNTVLCQNGSTTLTAGSVNARYANKVLRVSSQSGNVQYSADMALGTPDVFPSYGPSGSAWTSQTADGQREFIELGFAGAKPINFVDIYETFNAGAIDSVFVKNPSTNQFERVFSATATRTPVNVSNKKRITFPLTSFAVSEIRIALALDVTSGYNAIDAVAIGTVASPDTLGTFRWSNDSTQNAITVNSPGKYTVTINDTSSCSSSSSVQVTSRTAVTPTISFQNSAIAKDTSICAGDSLILKATPGSGLTWSTGGTKDTIVVRQAGKYAVSYNDGTGCGATVSDTVVVSINALPTVSIIGALGICPGGTTVLDAGTGYSSYAWSTGASTRTITVYTTGVYSVTVKNSSGCAASASVTTFAASNPTPAITGTLQFCSGGSTTLDAGSVYSQYTWSTGAATQTLAVTSPGTYSVTVKNSFGCSGTASVQTTLFAPPVPSVSGAKAFCPGSSTLLTAAAGYNSYTWNTGARTSSITVSTVGNYTVTVTDNNGCSGSTTTGVTQLTPPSPTITGSQTFCGGSTGTLDAGPSYTSYLWSPGGATTQTLSITTIGKYSVTVTDSKGCSGSSSVDVTQQGSVPATPGPITGKQNGLCNSTGNVYTIAAVTGAGYYVWTVPDGATITAGDGTTSITVSYAATFTSGFIQAAAANACGQSSSLNPSQLKVNAPPPTPSSITGSLVTGVCGKTNVTYSISPVTGATSYTWTAPTGATIASGQGAASITVNFTSTFTSGNILVTANNSCGSSAVSSLMVSSKSIMNGSITGLTSVCAKQTSVTYTIPAATGATSYTWTVPSLATIKSGQGTNTITVDFSTKGGNVTVTATNACGTTTAQTLAVTSTTCSTKQSSVVSAQVVPTEVLLSERAIQAYPNPTKGLVTLNVTNMPSGNYQISVYDAFGRTVLKGKTAVQQNHTTLDLTKYAKGFYTIQLSDGVKNTAVKVVVQ